MIYLSLYPVLQKPERKKTIKYLLNCIIIAAVSSTNSNVSEIKNKKKNKLMTLKCYNKTKIIINQ